MHNIRPYLTKLANDIVHEHVSSGEKLSTLVAQKAASESLNDESIRHLVGITNKQYVLSSGSIPDFDIADYKDVVKSIYNDVSKSASDEYTSYVIPARHITSFKSFVSEDRSKTASNDSLTINFFNMDVSSKQEKLASLLSKTHDLYSSISNSTMLLKKAGMDLDSIVGSNSLSKEASDTVGVIYDQVPDYTYISNNLAKTLDIQSLRNSITDNIDALVKSASNLIDTQLELSKSLSDRAHFLMYGKVSQ